MTVDEDGSNGFVVGRCDGSHGGCGGVDDEDDV